MEPSDSRIVPPAAAGTDARTPAALTYLVAIGAVAAASLVRWALAEWLGNVGTFMPFVLAVLLAAWYGGVRPGLLATVLGGVAGYVLVPAGSTELLVSSRQALRLALYAAVGISISAVCGALHSARGRIDRQRGRWREAAEFHALLASLHSDYGFSAGVTATGMTVDTVTPGFTRLLGYTLEEANALGWQQLLHTDDLPRIAGLLQRLRGGEAVETEIRQVTRGGKTLWVWVHARPERDAAGRTVRVFGIARDVSERKLEHARRLAAENQIRAHREQLRLLADHAPVFLSHCDRELRFKFVNAPYAQRFGLQPEDVVGKHIGEVIGHDNYSRIEPYLQAVLEGQRADYDTEMTFGAKTQVLHAACVPERDPHGNVTGLVAAIIDITARKDAEAALREADRQKDHFLATLAHELRSPLAPLRKGIDLLRTMPDDPAALEEICGMMDRQVAQMVHLIDDLLDLSRIRRGQIKLRFERIELAPVVQTAVETVRPVIESCGHELTVSLPPTPLAVHGDAVRLAQVIANLLHNAAKYTDRGGHLALRAVREQNEVTIRVVDDGIGIPAELLGRIFEMFMQVDPGRSRGGLGIGLSLVKRVVELHAGTVAALSAGPGCGSEFVVRLPLARAETGPAGNAS